MFIVIKADDRQKTELLSKGVPENARIRFYTKEEPIPADADAYFDLLFEEQGSAFASISNKPVFVNAVITEDLPLNYFRINAWNGFLQREITELGRKQDSPFTVDVENIFEALHWKYQWVPDTPGMIAARVIAMIINEAYFGLGDEISTKAEIDIAMKLGTNYPYGPFEWSEKIGLAKIHALLKQLLIHDGRYAIAPALEKDALNNSA
jgi:3-hydroxybutyryl-CoA dehydrogenase